MALLSAVGVVSLIVAAAVVVSLSRDLPDPAALERIEFNQESVIFDRTGKLELARFGALRREVVTYDQVPDYLIDATTAIEDKGFWTNPGFDPGAIVAAGIDTIRGSRRGGSTITQQLVRQRLLDPALVADPARRIERKLKEIIQSIRVTETFKGDDGKRRIITAYLNQNYYGNQSYGVKAAARSYFGLTDLDELTLSQAATLAALLQSPTTSDLVRNAVEQCVDPPETQRDCTKFRLVVPDDAPIVRRRNLVLDLMASGRTPLSGHRFSATDFEAAKREPAVLAPQTPPRWIAPHFVWAVQDELRIRLCGGASTCPQLERGGFQIVSTLDARMQRIGERWVKAAAILPRVEDPAGYAKRLGLAYEPWMRKLRGKELHNGALVALDYQTGEILAYVGSADYEGRPTKRFQPKFDVLSKGWRQAGSAFKPITYVTGIDTTRITAATMLMDVVTDFGGGYTPTDADNLERGPVRARTALQFSLNIPAVRALAVIGIGDVFERAKALGLQFATRTTDAGLSLTLGTEETHPLDLTTAYGTIANGGRYAGRTAILRVTDASGGQAVPAYRPPNRQVVSAQAAYIITDILRGNTDPAINPFWGRFSITDGSRRRPATLKTGTNNDARDLNAYGYLGPPEESRRSAGEHALAVGVWNGNSDNSVVSTPDQPVFSIDVTTYVWQGFIREATKGWAVADFPRPDGLVERRVDPWTGLEPRAAGPSVVELFVEGTGPRKPPASVTSGSCLAGEALLSVAGFEAEHPNWLAADLEWLARARTGPGVTGGPERTKTSYFYNGAFQPFGPSWGALIGARSGGCASLSPSPTATASPSASATASATPSHNVAPSALPGGATPVPTAPPAGTPEPVPTVVPEPPPAPTPEPTEQPPAVATEEPSSEAVVVPVEGATSPSP